MSRRRTIVCLSSQKWNDGMWTNKQHIMSRLGKDHDVLFVNFGPTGVQPSLTPRLAEPHAGVTTLDFYEPTALTRHLPVHHALAIALTFDLRVRLLRRELRRRGVEDAIVWVYHPGYGAGAATIPAELLVYDCVDEYTEFPDYREHSAWVREREERLCRRADLVFTTSKPLFESKRAYNPGRTHLVHNVGDAEHFLRAADHATRVPDDVAALAKPIVMFVGAVSGYKLNMEWLVYLARARPSWSVVVIGPEGVGDISSDAQALRTTANIHLLGHRPYAELPAYLKAADVTTIPYRLNRYTEHCFPIKFFEMLATGKPVVISRLAALADFYDAVLVADGPESFVQRCEEALAGDHGREARVALALANSWSARVSRLMELVGRYLP